MKTPSPPNNGTDNSSDSEEQIEMKQNPDSEDPNPNGGDPVTNQKQIDPELRAAIEREKFYAIEEEYEKFQEKLFEEVKDRIRIEQKQQEEEEAKKSKKSKSKDRGKNRKEERRPERPQHDQIGSSSKSKNNAPDRRRRR